MRARAGAGGGDFGGASVVEGADSESVDELLESSVADLDSGEMGVRITDETDAGRLLWSRQANGPLAGASGSYTVTVAGRVWRIELRPTAKLVVTSGSTADEVMRGNARAYGIAFLPKPFTSEALVRTVRSALDMTAR